MLLTGDFNSYYTRDDIVAAFIDPIQATGRATVGDVWIEKYRNGVYPKVGGEKDAEELLDKILYVNPVGGIGLKPVTVTVDMAGYQYKGKPLGDHYPLLATFSVEGRNTTGIDELTHDNTSGESFDLQGRPASRSSKGIHISNGHKYIKE